MGSIAQTVEAILGPSQVTPGEALTEPLRGAVRRAIATAMLPACIAYPETPAQLAEVVACAHQNRWRLLPCGHGSKLDWGALVSEAEVVISTQRLNQLIEHAAGDLTVTVQAGVGFADLQAVLGQTRQFLAIDPAYPQRATLGGIVATRDTGALRQRYGGLRDMLIGVSFVRHDGQVAKAGGRVVKNVAGYDLMKLMSGSYGTLGILTQLTLRTYPQSEASQTMLVSGAPAAIQALTAAVLRSPLTPVALDVISGSLLPTPAAATLGLALRFQSIAAGVAEQVAYLEAIAQPYPVALHRLTDEADGDFWQRLNATLATASQPEGGVRGQLGVAPAQAVDFLHSLQTTLTPDTWYARINASSGLGTVCLSSEQNTLAQVAAVRSRCQATQGYFNLLTAPVPWKEQLTPWAIAPATHRLMRALRAKFDPDQRLSPGRFG